MHPSERATINARRLAARLADAQRRQFVGREPERTLFERALGDGGSQFAVLHVFGPGGIGKSSLLHQFAAIAQGAGYETLRVDGRNIEPTPAGFTLELGSMLGLHHQNSIYQHFDAQPRQVLLLDTYELLEPLDRWLRDVFIPQLSDETIVVIAGRNAPDPAWRTEPGWSELIQLLPLRNLEPRASRDYLAARGVDERYIQPALDLTHGHPLALSLMGDLLASGISVETLELGNHPDIVGLLVEHIVQAVPSATHRLALEICVHVRATTAALLADVIGTDAADEAFGWLRRLSFIEQGPHGLFPHDLARDVIDTETRWRDPDRYRLMHQQVRKHIVDRLQQTTGIEQQRAFFDLLYLHRTNKFMKPLFDWASMGHSYSDMASEQEKAKIIEIIRCAEGEASERIARHWINTQPEAFQAFRNQSDELLGFAAHLRIENATPEEIALDPAIGPALAFADQYGPARPGESLLYHRYSMSIGGHFLGGDVANMVGMSTTIFEISDPHLAWSYIVTPNPDYWYDVFTYLGMRRALEADFELNGINYAVFAHDWRVEPVDQWIDVMAEREIATDLSIEMLEKRPTSSLVVLSRPAFEDAVRTALRDFTRQSALGSNPLTRSRLVREADKADAPTGTLHRLILKAVESLNTNPRDQKRYQALYRTYIEPAATQELAAEALNVPFSTYRYHLAGGTERVIEWLWQRELNAAANGPTT
jgi:hypothetical protein